MASPLQINQAGNFFTVQWHITSRCDYCCSHCYEGNDSDNKCDDFSTEYCYEIIDKISDWSDYLNIKIRMNLTGGDPLIRKDIYDIIEYCKEKEFMVGILGNPDRLNDSVVEKLKKSGISRYQISLDGTEKTHDYLRNHVGAFKKSINAINTLKKHSILSVVMFTVTRKNMNDLIPLIDIVDNLKVSIFDFARLVPMGSGAEMKGKMLSPIEYQELLFAVLQKYQKIQRTTETYFGRKEHLWNLLYKQIGLMEPLPKDKETIYGGCGIGYNILTILNDGSVLTCRRLPIKIGDILSDDLNQIYFHSKIMNDLRDEKRMIKCGECDLLQFCRGCPAVAYHEHSDPFAPDPQCWK